MYQNNTNYISNAIFHFIEFDFLNNLYFIIVFHFSILLVPYF